MGTPSLSAWLGFVWSHPSNRRHRVRAVARAVAWQLWKRATGRPWDVTVGRGLRLRCHGENAFATLALYAGGRPDPVEQSFLEHYLRPGDDFLDVGANVGFYTLVAASLTGPDGRVEAFEPGSRTRSRLLENVGRNGLESRVTVHAAATGDRPGRLRFRTGLDAQNRLCTADDEGDDEGEGDGASFEEVEVVTLDDALAGRRFAAGKMDIEGAEVLALAGAAGLLAAASPPVWILEVNDALRRFGASEEELVSRLDASGYDLALYEPTSRTLTLAPDAWRGHQNVLAIARSARAEILHRLGGRLVTPTGAATPSSAA